MSIITQILLIVSYTILAAGVLVLGPSWFGLAEQTASIMAVFVFFAVWHLQFLITSYFENKKLNQDLSDLRFDLDQLRSSTLTGNENTPSEVIAELKILQGLLSQLAQRPKLEDANSGAIDIDAEKFIDEGVATNIPAIKKRALSSEDIMNITQAALIENRVDLYMQPIVYLPARNVVHYECFSRVRSNDGIVIDAERYISFVKDKGLAGTLDNLLFFRLIQVIRKLGPRQPAMKFFCNMSKESLNDQNFFPQFVDYISNNRDFAGRIVLEISHEDYDQLSDKVLNKLQSLGRHGCTFSIDQLLGLDMDFSVLEERYVRYLKIDLAILLDEYDSKEIPELVSTLRARQIYLILSKVETEQDSFQAIECQSELAQGYLYGELRPAQEYTQDF